MQLDDFWIVSGFCACSAVDYMTLWVTVGALLPSPPPGLAHPDLGAWGSTWHWAAPGAPSVTSWLPGTFWVPLAPKQSYQTKLSFHWELTLDCRSSTKAAQEVYTREERRHGGCPVCQASAALHGPGPPASPGLAQGGMPRIRFICGKHRVCLLNPGRSAGVWPQLEIFPRGSWHPPDLGGSPSRAGSPGC